MLRMLPLIHFFMPLDQNAIEELKKIHFAEYGERLTDQEAWDMAINLINQDIQRHVLAEDRGRAERPACQTCAFGGG